MFLIFLTGFDYGASEYDKAARVYDEITKRAVMPRNTEAIRMVNFLATEIFFSIAVPSQLYHRMTDVMLGSKRTCREKQ